MVYVILGAQWGDEGKGKITDYLADQADIIVRFQGGNNAGHTVIVDDQTFKLHLIPSGICRKKVCVLGNGVVINPLAMVKEIETLQKIGMNPIGKLWISDRAHLIKEEHLIRDKKEEDGRNEKVGTTGKGIGPSYSDKVKRIGTRMGEWKDLDNWSDEYKSALEVLDSLIIDTSHFLNQARKNSETILLEGAQGTFLDIDHGTYPFVTSSNPTSGGACTGSGIPPTALTGIIGILKAYTTRVGFGPFPTEDTTEVGQYLQEKGHEFGTTTGRIRRCGHLDLFMANYSAMVNGINGWVITKLDVLTGLDKIKVCTGYKFQDSNLESYPGNIKTLDQVEAIYKEFEGWNEDISQINEWSQLPKAAQIYINFIEDYTGVAVKIVSCGPERNQTIVRQSPINN